MGQDTEYRHILKVHKDVLTVPEEINKLYKEYEELGYRMHFKLPNSFSYYLEDDSLIMVYWSKGMIYEDVAVIGKQEVLNENYEEQEV